jgi:hypothetical protein
VVIGHLDIRVDDADQAEQGLRTCRGARGVPAEAVVRAFTSRFRGDAADPLLPRTAKSPVARCSGVDD